jgi:hypothetical protein
MRPRVEKPLQMSPDKSLQNLGLRRGQKARSACGKACGIENHVRDFFQQRPIGRFWEGGLKAFKAMNSNQLCNSSGINMTLG